MATSYKTAVIFSTIIWPLAVASANLSNTGPVLHRSVIKIEKVKWHHIATNDTIALNVNSIIAP